MQLMTTGKRPEDSQNPTQWQPGLSRAFTYANHFHSRRQLPRYLGSIELDKSCLTVNLGSFGMKNEPRFQSPRIKTQIQDFLTQASDATTYSVCIFINICDLSAYFPRVQQDNQICLLTFLTVLACHIMCVQVNGQLAGISFPSLWSKEQNLGHQR